MQHLSRHAHAEIAVYVLATTDRIVRWYCVAHDWSSFELLDQLDLTRIVGYHDKAAARAAAQAIGLKTWRYVKIG